ncbi:MAG: ATP-binding protein [Thermodesulfobacteriota bacterium]
MIRLIEALNYRCLRYVSQELGPFHILVGPNASGKTTFLDVVVFLGRLVNEGLEAAVNERTREFRDLLFGRAGDVFELAIETAIPKDRRVKLRRNFDVVRYEIKIGLSEDQREYGIHEERVWLKTWRQRQSPVPILFPVQNFPPSSIMTIRAEKGWQRVLTKAHGGNDNFYVEVRDAGKGKGWFPSIKLGPKKSALANLPEDEEKFPVATWLKWFLTQNIQTLILNSLIIRKASPPGQIRGFKPDGSNLPWVIDDLKKKAPDRFENWIRHLRTALQDEVRDIHVIIREDDRHAYLIIEYERDLKVPSWMASDGTLRLLALTLPAYLPDFQGVYLIEEPENGIHPTAAETVFQSLSSVYDAQILLATHSPIFLSHASPESVLCFKKTDIGSTDIVLGSKHPALLEWQGQPNLSVLFAGGVLG